MKYCFLNDYSEGAHPNILNRLEETNIIQEPGYGLDSFSLAAIELIKQRIGNKKISVHFVAGGTLANLSVLSSILKPYESIISVSSGHINVHEGGAIEATGHKIETVYSVDGKIKPEQIESLIKTHEDEHMVKPKLVYISNSTEIGTIYSKTELEALSDICKKFRLYLYLDGARLGSALSSIKNDLLLSEMASLVDAFYIGGTKNGALLGEAIVIVNPEIQADFRKNLKQRGALLAKGRILGIQFEELLKDDLWLALAKRANFIAGLLSKGISECGYKFQSDSSTNQIFPIFPNKVINNLKTMYEFYIWDKIDQENSSIRLCTSWATKEEVVYEFLSDLKSIV